MRIAFDLDQTLIPWEGEFPIEDPVPVRRFGFFFRERFRQGTSDLLRQLQARGCEIWVYTTSARGPLYLRIWFLLLGIRLAGVINCDRHAREARSTPYRFPAHCSKYPPAFGIDLLVDDSEGVVAEGPRFGFEVLRVDPADSDWAERVLEAVNRRLPLAGKR